MLPWIIDRLMAHDAEASQLAALAKITPRAALAAVLGFLLAIVCGRRIIRWLQARFREPIKTASPELARLHGAKRGTPTMGGLFIVAAIVCATLIFAHGNPLVRAALVLTVALAALGACDDLMKLRTAARGMSAKGKLAAQACIATLVALWVYREHAQTPGALDLTVPFTNVTLELGGWFVPWAALVIVGSSNAVNLSDGLDGLAGGCLACATAAMAAVVYAAGHAPWAAHLNLVHIPNAGELAIVAAATLGGVLGFLWFNCHPASVFMGDTGSLPLGGLLGLLAVAARQEWAWMIIGGVFVAEALSVILQVAWYRRTRRRIFLCAPLHHHFQMRGWPEDKIVVRFWIAAVLCAVAGMAGLKLNTREAVPLARRAPAPAATHVVAKIAQSHAN